MKQVRQTTKAFFGAVLMCSFIFYLFAGLISHRQFEDASHVHGYAYSHLTLDVHKGLDEKHDHGLGTDPLSSGSVIPFALTGLSNSWLLLGLMSLIFLYFRDKSAKELLRRSDVRKRNYSDRDDFVTPLHTRLLRSGILNPKLY